MKYQFAFGKEDHFLRRITVGPEAGTPIVTESYKGVTTSVTLTPALFTYKPAAGAVVMAPPKEPSYFDPALKVGAAPFPLTGSDLQGKKVTLAEYKGKVLMLDFWATCAARAWQRLPNVQEAYKKYHDKGFEIVGISLDQETDKAKLESFTHEKGMPCGDTTTASTGKPITPSSTASRANSVYALDRQNRQDRRRRSTRRSARSRHRGRARREVGNP